jgi:hypothetical protein
MRAPDAKTWVRIALALFGVAFVTYMILIPAGDAMDVIRAYVLIDQAGRVALAVERGFADTDPTLPPD